MGIFSKLFLRVTYAYYLRGLYLCTFMYKISKVFSIILTMNEEFYLYPAVKRTLQKTTQVRVKLGQNKIC